MEGREAEGPGAPEGPTWPPEAPAWPPPTVAGGSWTPADLHRADQDRAVAADLRRERGRRRRKRRILAGVGVAAFAVVAGAVMVEISLQRADTYIERRTVDHGDDAFDLAFAPIAADQYPQGPDGRQDEPLGRPLEVADHPSHAFRSSDWDDAPARYDPCRPIHVVINDEAMPPAAEGMVERALDEVSRITGLQFEIDGRVDELAIVSQRETVQPERYGDRWAPVLIAWADPTQIPELDGEVIGLGGSTAVGDEIEGPLVLVTGTVTLDAPQMAELIELEGGAPVARSVILHELGHLVGLDHVDDPAQIMAPRASYEVTEFGPGDRAGLAQLGGGPCVPRY